MEINGKNFGELFLAPMAGVSEVGFRTVCKMSGADLTYTEMVNATALIHNSNKTKELLITNKIEKPVAVQIFGHNPEDMAKVCILPELEKFDLIDINFGCPAPKIVKNGDGSALLKDLKTVQQIVDKVVKASTKPVSCKFRIGFENGHNVAIEMAKICEDAGAKIITVHGRTREQMYSGLVDLETIAKVKQISKLYVVGNGDVTDEKSYNLMKQTGVDAVMIGRGALGNPNVFAQIKNLPAQSKIELIKKHIQVLRQNYSENFVSVTMKKHLLWYIAGERDASKYKLKIATCPSLDQSVKIVEKILNAKN